MTNSFYTKQDLLLTKQDLLLLRKSRSCFCFYTAEPLSTDLEPSTKPRLKQSFLLSCAETTNGEFNLKLAERKVNRESF